MPEVLVSCAVCQEEMSGRASSCPRCGDPKRLPSEILVRFGALAGFLLSSDTGTAPDSPPHLFIVLAHHFSSRQWAPLFFLCFYHCEYVVAKKLRKEKASKVGRCGATAIEPVFYHKLIVICRLYSNDPGTVWNIRKTPANLAKKFLGAGVRACLQINFVARSPRRFPGKEQVPKSPEVWQ